MGQEQSATTDELMAYVDGQLPAEALARVEAFVTENEAARAEVEAYRLQNILLHGAYDKVLEERVPRRLLWPTVSATWMRLSVAACALLVVGGAIGWYARDLAVPSREVRSFAQRALAAHAVYLPEVRHPVEVPATEEAHLVAWLSKRLGTSVRAPVLAEFNYRLVGGRLLPGESGRPAAQFMYEDPQGQRLTLYVSGVEGDATDTAFRYAKERNLDVFYWIDRKWGYALSGAVGRERMLELSNAIYKQLTPG
ncbi:MAG: anti-sigma factor family protein [Burkholderiales bacterium]